MSSTAPEVDLAPGLTIKKRITCACDRCRKSKLKCNGRSPCDRCSHKNIVCTYSPRKVRYGKGKKKKGDDDSLVSPEGLSPMSSPSNDQDLVLSVTTSQYLSTYFLFLNPSRQWLERERLLEPRSKAELVQYNMAIAMAARSLRDAKVTKSCEMRARALAADIFDDFSMGSIRAFAMLMYFYWGQDSRLSLHYRNIALSLCNCLKNQRTYLQLEGPRAQVHSLKSLVALENAGRTKSAEEVTPLKLLEIEMFVANWNDVHQQPSVPTYDSTMDHLRNLVRKSDEKRVIGSNLNHLDANGMALLQKYINKNFDKTATMEMAETSALLQMLICSEQLKREFSPVLMFMTQNLYASREEIIELVNSLTPVMDLDEYAKSLDNRMENHFKMLLYCHSMIFERSMIPLVAAGMLTMRAVVQLALGFHTRGGRLAHLAILEMERGTKLLPYAPPFTISTLHLLIQGCLKHRFLEMANRVSGLQRIIAEVLPRMKQMMWDDMTLLKEAARLDSEHVRPTPPPATVAPFVTDPLGFIDSVVSKVEIRPGSSEKVAFSPSSEALSSPGASSPAAPALDPLFMQEPPLGSDALMFLPGFMKKDLPEAATETTTMSVEASEAFHRALAATSELVEGKIELDDDVPFAESWSNGDAFSESIGNPYATPFDGSYTTAQGSDQAGPSSPWSMPDVMSDLPPFSADELPAWSG